MDLWQLIANDHANIASICEDILRTLPGSGAASRERLFDQLDGELRRHMQAEEESLFDALGDHERTRRLVDRLEDEHDKLRLRLSGLARDWNKGSRDWTQGFRTLASLIEWHFQCEEDRLIPAAREILDPETVQELRHEFAEEKIAELRRARSRGWASPRTGALLAAVAGAAAGTAAILAWQRNGSRRGPAARRTARRPDAQSGVAGPGHGRAGTERGAVARHREPLRGRQNSEEEWGRVLAGDRNAFNRLIEPYLDELREAARHEIAYRVSVGDLGSGALSPDDVVAEVLIRAWDERQRRPANLDLKAWLLGLLYRTADGLVKQEKRMEDLAPVSLDAAPGSEAFPGGWRQPEDFESWEEVVPDPRSSPDETSAAVESRPGALSEPARRVLLMHDRHGIPLRQAAFVMKTSVAKAQDLLLDARRAIQG